MGHLRSSISKLSSWCLSSDARIGGLVKFMSSSARVPYSAGRRGIPKVDKVLLVASGKGGVGKSTTADADVSGPSVPRMMNVAGIQPQVTGSEPGQIIPLQNYGIHCMSVGSLVEQGKALTWRGPMVGKALEQLLFGVVWGNLDVLVIDMPPGTGDTHITLSQRTTVAGAIMVTTPQEVALEDVRRSIRMLQHMNIDTVGVLENMSYHICSGCGKHSNVFGTGGAEKLAEEFDMPILGKVPLNESAMQGGESGTPIVVGDPASPLTAEYHKVAAAAWQKLQSQS